MIFFAISKKIIIMLFFRHPLTTAIVLHQEQDAEWIIHQNYRLNDKSTGTKYPD